MFKGFSSRKSESFNQDQFWIYIFLQLLFHDLPLDVASEEKSEQSFFAPIFIESLSSMFTKLQFKD